MRGELGVKGEIFAGKYGRYLLPAVIFQSVLIGGGYATGREIVEFGGRFGALGVWSVVAIFLGFSLISVVAYEFARFTRAYNYRAYTRRLIGPAWPLFDILFVVMAVIVVAVMSSAAGEIGSDVIGIPYVVGVGVVILLVAFLNFYGRGLIERFKSVGTVLLYMLFIVLGVAVLTQRWSQVGDVFARSDTSYVESATVWAAFSAGILYVSYNLVVMPAVLFSLDRQTRFKETVWSGILTGVLSTLPFVLTYLCIQGFYPNEDVLGAPVPWLAMIGEVGVRGLSVLFAVLVMYTLVETATGVTHAIVDRIDDALAEAGRPHLTATQSALFTGAVLVAASIFAQVGIIALVAQGYTTMAYGFLVLFALPLLTIGLYRVIAGRRTTARSQPEPLG